MNQPTLVIDIFVGLTLAAAIVSFYALYFVQRHYTEPAIIRPLRLILVGLLPTFYSIVQVWLVERGIVTAHWTTWAIAIAVASNLCCSFTAWRMLRKISGHSHLARLTRALGWALAFGTISFILQCAASFWDVGMVVNGGRAIAGMGALFITCVGAFLVRARYPGAGIEALIIAGSVTAIIVCVTFIGQTNSKVESIVISNQTRIFQEFISKQSSSHLTTRAFDGKSAEGKKELRDFIQQFETPSLRRIKVMLPDGYIIGSNLESLVGTRASVTEDVRKALRGDGTVRFTPNAEELPPTEQALGTALVVTMPLRVDSGQGTQGVLRLFLDSQATDSARLSLQSSAIGFTLLYLAITQVFLLALFLVYRRTVSHPFAELQDEMKNIHEGHDDPSGEHRRLHVKTTGPYKKIAQDFNALINEFEERDRKLRSKIREKGWDV